MDNTKSQCPHCGKVASRPNALFCARCGASLTAGTGRTEITDRRSLSAKIVVRTTDRETPEEFALTGVLITLGRHESNTIPLSHPIISRQHAKIERTRQGHTLTDLNSTNGTFVNGQRLTPNVPRLLASNDVIHLGQVSDEATRLIYLVLAPAPVADEAVVSPPPPHVPEVASVEQEVPTLGIPGQLEFDRSLAVVIGIDDYGHGIPPLRTAGKDARRLAQILEDDYGYDVRLLVEDVTLERLNSLLTDTLANEVGSNDRVLVYFAGHGIALEGDDGPAGYLVPQDGRPEDRGTFLRMDQLHDALMALECRHMLVILDCCFAGAMRWSITRDIQMVPEVIHQERYERFIRDPAWQLITSAAYDQKALDILSGDVLGERGDLSSREHSPFALALFEALAGAGDVVPPGEGDGVITACELYLYLRDYVEIKAEEEEGHYQTPSLWPLKKHDKGEYIFLVPGRQLNLPPAPELTTENNPYRGLQPFEEEHAQLFFGRKDLVEALAETVSERPLTVVLGASGTGKSSLVKAGLLPHLGGTGEADLSIGGEQVEDLWYILPPMRPTESPLRELEHLIRHNLPASVRMAGDEGLRAAPIALADVIAHWGQAHPGQRLLLVIDQFEELVTLCRDDREREQFLGLLSTALDAVPERLRIVLTLRSDFEPQLSDSALQAHWKQGRFIVPPMNRAELREAITEPASVRVLYFEPSDLVDRLIDEVIQTPGALPLLSFTLSELYVKYVQRRSDDRALTEGDYRALGGVAGSLRNRATEEYTALAPPYQATMKRIMLRMVASEGGELARRRVSRSELVYPDEIENRRVETVIQRLTEARLIVMGETEEGGPYVEPAHDALVRAWDRLLIWSREAEEYLPLQRRLTQAAGDWADTVDEDTKKDLLWHDDPRLPQVEQALAGDAGVVKQGWLARQFARFRDLWSTKGLQVVEGHWLNKLELDFIQQSVNQRRREARRLVGTVTGVIVALTALTIFSFYQVGQTNIASNERATAIAVQKTEIAQRTTAEAVQATEIISRTTAEAEAVNAAATAEAERGRAEEQARLALSRQLMAQSELIRSSQWESWVTGVLLAVESLRRSPQFETVQLLQQMLEYLGPAVIQVDHQGTVFSVAFSMDERWLATAGDGIIRVWDTTTGTEVMQMDHGGPVHAFSPDGRWLASGGGYSDNIVRLWNVATGQVMARLEHEGGVLAAAFSSDGLWVVSGGFDGTTRVWETATGEEVARLESGVVHTVAFSPEGEHVITISGQFEVRAQVWDWRREQELSQTDLGTAVDASSSAISLDWKLVAYNSGCTTPTSCSVLPQGTVVVDRESGQRISERLKVGGARGGNLQFSADNTWLSASGSVWNPRTGQEAARFGGGTFSPSGKWLALSVGNRVWVGEWDRRFPQVFSPLSGLRKIVAVSPDGAWLVTSCPGPASDQDRTHCVWEVATSQQVTELVDERFLAFSPDGQWIATESDGNVVWVREAATGQQVARLGHEEQVWSVVFSPDGRWVVSESGSWDNSAGASGRVIRVWEVATEAEINRMTLDTFVDDVIFSPDGQWMAVTTGNPEYRVLVWETSTWREVTVDKGDETVYAVAFSPNGQWMAVATGHPEYVVFEWVTDTWQEMTSIEGEGTVTDMDIAFSPDGQRMVAVNLANGVARLLDTETWQEIAQMRDRDVEVTLGMIHFDEFTTDSNWILTHYEMTSYSGQGGKTVSIWNAITGQEFMRLDLENYVDDAFFVPHSPWLVTQDRNGEIQVWVWRPEDLIAEACDRLPRNLTPEEWRQYIGTEEYHPTCPNLPVPEG